MGKFADERVFLAEADLVFVAVTRALHALRWNVRSTDQYALEVAFSTPISAASWGAYMLASVSPVPEGGLVRVSGASRVRRNFMANAQERTNIIRLLDAVSERLHTT